MLCVCDMAVGLLFKVVFHWVVGTLPGGAKWSVVGCPPVRPCARPPVRRPRCGTSTDAEHLLYETANAHEISRLVARQCAELAGCPHTLYNSKVLEHKVKHIFLKRTSSETHSFEKRKLEAGSFETRGFET